MKKSILELKGVELLTKNEQKSISGGWGNCCRDVQGSECLGVHPRCQHH